MEETHYPNTENWEETYHNDGSDDNTAHDSEEQWEETHYPNTEDWTTHGSEEQWEETHYPNTEDWTAHEEEQEETYYPTTENWDETYHNDVAHATGYTYEPETYETELPAGSVET